MGDATCASTQAAMHLLFTYIAAKGKAQYGRTRFNQMLPTSSLVSRWQYHTLRHIHCVPLCSLLCCRKAQRRACREVLVVLLDRVQALVLLSKEMLLKSMQALPVPYFSIFTWRGKGGMPLLYFGERMRCEPLTTLRTHGVTGSSSTSEALAPDLMPLKVDVLRAAAGTPGGASAGNRQHLQ